MVQTNTDSQWIYIWAGIPLKMSYINNETCEIFDWTFLAYVAMGFEMFYNICRPLNHIANEMTNKQFVGEEPLHSQCGIRLIVSKQNVANLINYTHCWSWASLSRQLR